MALLSQFSYPGILFLLTLVFGFWLSKLGRPYRGLLFNFHKLLALGAVIFTGLQLTAALKGVETLGLIILLLSLAGLCVVLLFVTGALMSLGKFDYQVSLRLHQAAPFIAASLFALIIYQLIGRNP